MLKHLGPIFLMLFCLVKVEAQHECGFHESEEVISSYKTMLKSMRPLDTKREVDQYLITPYIITTDLGDGGLSVEDLEEAMIVLNERYAEANIEFVYCGDPIYIRESRFVELDLTTERELILQKYYNNNSINVYFANRLFRSSSGLSICGNASFPNSSVKRAIFMNNACVTNGSTYPHEFGHYFGLLHTHSTSLGSEAVDGSNCGFAGDGFCDTPADPRLSSESITALCRYVGNETDFKGHSYEPDPRNIMSYSRKQCRDYFSPLQLIMIQNTAAAANLKYKKECASADVVVKAEPIDKDYKARELLEVPFSIEDEVKKLNYNFDLKIEIENFASIIIHNETMAISSEELAYDGLFQYTLPSNLSSGSYNLTFEVDLPSNVYDSNEFNNKVTVPFDVNYLSYKPRQSFYDPATKELTFYNRSLITRFFKVSIFNSVGQVVYAKEEKRVGPDVINTYNLDSLTDGVYYVVFSTDDEILDSSTFYVLD